MRSLAVLCISLLVALAGGTAPSWAAPIPEASTPTAACPETLLPLPNRARVVRDLAPGVTLRVWRVEQPAAYGDLPRRAVISAVHVRAGADLLSPVTAGIPQLIRPEQAFDRRSVVAAVNGDYFESMRQGDALPAGALVVDGRPIYAPVGMTRVVAVDDSGLARHARITADVTIMIGDEKVRPRGINDPTAPEGRAVIFTGDWSRSDVPGGRHAIAIKDGRVIKVFPPQRKSRVPQGGYIVWTDLPGAIDKLSVGTRVEVSMGVKARDGLPVVSASGHGGQFLVDGKLTQPCTPYENNLRPRTLIAWNPAGDVWLLTASTGLPDPPGGLRVGGATKNQMAQVAKSLGATDAVTMDGGGSTSLFVREGAGPRRIDLPQDVWTRPVPVVWTISRG